jgi:hypothetical protein
MRKSVLYAVAGLAALALPAAAQNLHVNDAAYVGIARCQGLYDSNELAPKVDPTGINRFMDLESSGRSAIVLDEAKDARDRAGRDVATAGPSEKARLVAERDGPCHRWRSMGAHAPGGALTGS